MVFNLGLVLMLSGKECFARRSERSTKYGSMGIETEWPAYLKQEEKRCRDQTTII